MASPAPYSEIVRVLTEKYGVRLIGDPRADLRAVLG